MDHDMFTSPTPPWMQIVASQGQGPGFPIPVQESIWNLFCPKGEAESLLQQIKAGLVTDAVLVDASVFLQAEHNLYLEPEVPNPTACGVWRIQGTLTKLDGTVLAVDESAGYLIDRQTKPTAADHSVDDHNPLGGPILGWRDDNGGQAQLFWSVDPVAPHQ